MHTRLLTPLLRAGAQRAKQSLQQLVQKRHFLFSRRSEDPHIATLPLVEIDQVLSRRRLKRWGFISFLAAAAYSTIQSMSLSVARQNAKGVDTLLLERAKPDQLEVFFVKMKTLATNNINWDTLCDSKVIECAALARYDPHPGVRVAAKNFLAVLAETNDKLRSRIASEVGVEKLVQEVFAANGIEKRSKTGYAFVSDSEKPAFSETISDDLLLCRLFANQSLHSKLLPALPYVVQLLDDEDPTVRRTAVNAIYYLTETVTGRVALAHTEAFKKIYEMLFSPDKDVTLVNDGSPGQSETIRRAKKALQNMVLSQAAITELLNAHEAFMFSMDPKAKNLLLKDFDYERSRTLEAVWTICRGSIVATVFALVWGPIRYLYAYNKIGRVPTIIEIINRVTRRTVTGSIGIFSLFQCLSWVQNDYINQFGTTNYYMPVMVLANATGAALFTATTWMFPYTLFPALMALGSDGVERYIRSTWAETRALGPIHNRKPQVASQVQPKSDDTSEPKPITESVSEPVNPNAQASLSVQEETSKQ